MNLSKLEFVLLKHLKIQLSEIDKLEFYRFEFLVEHFKEWAEEEKKRQETEEKKSGDSKTMESFKKDFANMKSSATPKMPNFKI
jgi:predicted Rossmann fold nucleotide-binding protein DprA/Smf involved in DNA uptake